MNSVASPAVPDALAPPAGNPRFPMLDGLRGIAAISVLLFHAELLSNADHTAIGRPLSHLDVGVTVFFALTGFLLYRPLAATLAGQVPPTPARVFYRRRILRIIPAYWVAFGVLAATVGLTYADGNSLRNLAFLQIYRDDWARTGILPAWSVCVEITFYAVLPAYAAIIARLARDQTAERKCEIGLAVLGVLTVASLAWRQHVLAGSSMYGVDVLPGTFGWFAVGMCAALISVHPGGKMAATRGAIGRHQRVCAAGALTLYAIVAASSVHGGVEFGGLSMFAAYAAIAALIAWPAMFQASDRGVLGSGPVAWLGLVSYGIYLYHFDVLVYLRDHDRVTGAQSGTIVLIVVGGVAAVLCGAASYYLIERPALRLKRATSSTSVPRSR